MKHLTKTGFTLAAVAAICTVAVSATYSLTEKRIAANQQAFLESRLRPALGGVAFDSSLTDNMIVLDPPHGLPGDAPAQIYKVFNQGRPAAILFAVSAMNGYAGPIRLLVGVDTEGVLTGIRIVEHNETPGLGDKIESDRSDWLTQFAGRSIGDPPPEAWRIQADGGDFDQLTGATVTPRAVVGAIRDALLYFERNRDSLFADQAEDNAD